MPQEKPAQWWVIVLRHFTTFVVIMGAIWWLATPRVEAFIMETVNDRITQIENTLKVHTNQLNEILRMLRNERQH